MTECGDGICDSRKIVKVAVAVVLRGDEVFVGKRLAGATLGGFDEFPGGKVAGHESPGCAAIRECFEETGLSIETGQLLDLVEHQYDHALVSIYFFLCSLSSDAKCDTPELPWRWIPVSQLQDCQFPPANDSVISSLIELFD